MIFASASFSVRPRVISLLISARVDLPLPFGPVITTSSPGLKLIETSSKIWRVFRRL